MYSIRKSDNETFFAGRRVDVMLNGRCIGSFGVVHPQVLKGFEIDHPCSALELDLEVFL